MHETTIKTTTQSSITIITPITFFLGEWSCHRDGFRFHDFQTSRPEREARNSQSRLDLFIGSQLQTQASLKVFVFLRDAVNSSAEVGETTGQRQAHGSFFATYIRLQ
jgi:hypothetical protein